MTKIASFVSQNWIVPLYTVLSVHDIVSIQMKNIGLNILNTLYNMPYLPTKRHSENKMFEFRIQIETPCGYFIFVDFSMLESTSMLETKPHSREKWQKIYWSKSVDQNVLDLNSNTFKYLLHWDDALMVNCNVSCIIREMMYFTMNKFLYINFLNKERSNGTIEQQKICSSLILTSAKKSWVGISEKKCN